MKAKLFVFLLLIAVATVNAKAIPGKAIWLPRQAALGIANGSQQERTPEYNFSVVPRDLMTSYYDYMIGGYNNLPLQTVPSNFDSGYFQTYIGRRAATSYKRVFYSYLDSQGTLINNNEITPVYDIESNSCMEFDTISGKPLYAWQEQDWGDDPPLEILFTTDAFIVGIGGLINDICVVIDNPVNITAPNGTTISCEFLYPSIASGPSPIAGKRRVYILARAAENVYLAFADFNAEDIEYGIPLVWTYNSIPELNGWAADATPRTINFALAVDNTSRVYVAGYHVSEAEGTVVDVFLNQSYGSGEWQHFSASSSLPAWNPPSTPSGTEGYFVDETGEPYTDNQLNWEMMNSGHLNATLDANGKLHLPGLWGLTNSDGGYYPEMQYVKEIVFNPINMSFAIQDIYPRKTLGDSVNVCYNPWDKEAPWGVVDSYGGNATEGWYPNIATDWNFPHWDDSAHDNTMMFHYNNIKITEANSQGMMAVLWQNSQRARQYNYYQNPAYAQFADVPEVFIAVSPDNGNSWYGPVMLSEVVCNELNNLKPMWAYPADKMIFTGYNQGYPIGKLGMMFYNDYTWGANSLTPPYHPENNGGKAMFTEVQIAFQPGYETVAPPIFSPIAGYYNVSQNVTISCNTLGTQIHYTLDGSNPSSESALYTTPIPVSQNTTIKAKAYHPILEPSQTVSATYTLTASSVSFQPTMGDYIGPVWVTMTSSTPGASIHYTVNGNVPNESDSLYTGPVCISNLGYNWVKAKAFKPNWNPGTVSMTYFNLYEGYITAPIIHPPGCSFSDSLVVTMDCVTPEAVIHYTLNGQYPTEDSPIYSAPITLLNSALVRAKAYRPNWLPSQLADESYTYLTANPEEPDIPAITGILGIRPNPFRSHTSIDLNLGSASAAYSLKIYNLRGENVYSKDGLGRGLMQLDWDGRDSRGARLPRGLYLLRFTSGNERSTGKVVLQ